MKYFQSTWIYENSVWTVCPSLPCFLSLSWMYAWEWDKSRVQWVCLAAGMPTALPSPRWLNASGSETKTTPIQCTIPCDHQPTGL